MVLNVGVGTGVSALERHADYIGLDPSAAVHIDRTIGSAGRRSVTITDDDTAADGAPDRVADYTGGAAARLRRVDGTPVPGRLYLMMATVGSDDHARVFEQTLFAHDRGPHSDTIESNHLAVATAEAITGNDIELIEFTTAPGGGPSGGLIYLIGYLNLVSDGAFTADLTVAATGEIEAEGYIRHVRGADEKLGAADLAGADVFFTASAPSHAAVAEHAERHAGHLYRSRYGRATLATERALDDYERWGATRPDALDVVKVGHIADVAAYLCGAASEYACSIADLLGTTVTSDTLSAYDIVRAARTPSAGPTLGDPSLGVQIMSDTHEQRVAIEDAVEAFAAAGLRLPSVRVVFDSEDESCNGHLGLFQPSLQPWSITICSELDFVPVHELAHAWIEANVDELTRLRYLELRGSASWNSSEDDWSDRGVEDAAFVIQQNLTAGVTGELNHEWEARATAYELLTGIRSPLRVTSSTLNPGPSEHGTF